MYSTPSILNDPKSKEPAPQRLASVDPATGTYRTSSDGLITMLVSTVCCCCINTFKGIVSRPPIIVARFCIVQLSRQRILSYKKSVAVLTVRFVRVTPKPIIGRSLYSQPPVVANTKVRVEFASKFVVAKMEKRPSL